MEIDSIRCHDPMIYGINWNTDDEGNPRTPKPKDKPFCEYSVEAGNANLICVERVSTEHGRPKPYCKDHIFESPYVQDLLKRIEQVDDKADRKRADNAFKALEQEVALLDSQRIS